MFINTVPEVWYMKCVTLFSLNVSIYMVDFQKSQVSADLLIISRMINRRDAVNRLISLIHFVY